MRRNRSHHSRRRHLDDKGIYDSMKRSGILEVDRISALPEPILHHILSYLSSKEVVRTSVLSKTWNRAWRTFPDVITRDISRDPIRVKKILTYLEHALQKRQREMISVKKFELMLRLSNDTDIKSLLGRCLYLATTVDAKELVLGSWCYEWFNLPQIIYYAESLHAIDLSCCMLQLPRENVKLSSLRKLTLKDVSAGDQVIASLISGCPLVEYLEIIRCKWLRSLEVLNSSKLKKILLVTTFYLKKVKIEASSFNALTIRQREVPFPIEINVTSCKNLKCLTFYNVQMKDEWLCNEISKFPLLEYLSITRCNGLESIRISSLCLKTLIIVFCKDLIEVEIETPSLSVIKYEGSVISFSSSALCLSEASLGFSPTRNNQCLVQYIELLSTFQEFSEVLNLRSVYGNNLFIPEEIRQILCPPLTRFKQLSFSSSLGMYSITSGLDGLLWMSPHVEMVSITICERQKFSFQISYKKQVIYQGEIPQCCQTSPVSCWEHCIKEVKVEHIFQGLNGRGVRKYLFEGGVDIYGKIGSIYRKPFSAVS